MTDKEIKIEDLLSCIEHLKVRESCSRYLLIVSKGENLVSIDAIIEELKLRNTGKSVLLADYLESIVEKLGLSEEDLDELCEEARNEVWQEWMGGRK